MAEKNSEPIKVEIVKKPWYKKWWGITIIVLVALLAIGSLANQGEEETKTTKPATTKAKAPKRSGPVKAEPEPPKAKTPKLVSYTVEKIEPLHFSNVKRFTWHIVINEPSTPKQIKAVAKKIVKKAKEKESFNALAMSFYDHTEFVELGYTLGQITFAPGGDWVKANSVSTGDYDEMSLSFELRKKDWGQQLTKDEASVWSAWKEAYRKKNDEDPTDLIDEDQITNQIAQDKGMSAEDVKAILYKQITWTSMDK